MATARQGVRGGARKHWGWGYAGEQPTVGQLRAGQRELEARVGFALEPPRAPKPLARAALAEPKLRPPAGLGVRFLTDRRARARHALGSSFADVVRGFEGRFEHAPDLVALPAGQRQLEELLGWCEQERIAAIPYGGGTSVVGGVEPRLDGRYAGAVSIDLSRLCGLLELDPTSLSARVGAGTTGPQLERELAAHGLAFRHYPQSFQFSTVGGWVATRAAGHYGSGPTHVEERVEGLVAITPRGLWSSRRLPASGAGVSPDRLLAGSEGALGVITEVWLRVVRAVEVEARAAVAFPTFAGGAAALRELLQSDLLPTTCRLLDERERGLFAPGKGALLLLSFERRGPGAHRQAAAELGHALALCRGGGGRLQARSVGRRGQRSAAESAYRGAFFAGPYLRDLLVCYGAIAETFETAITWERLEGLVGAVERAVGAVAGEGRGWHLSCRLTHAYPDGAAPYFTVLAPSRFGEQVDCWLALKAAVSEAIVAAGGTITHHHAVGRDHMQWYRRQRPEPFARALAAAKRELDPRWIMNPGVLVDRPRRVDLQG